MLVPLSGMTLDRASTPRKDPGWVREQLALPTTRAIAAGEEGVLLSEGSEPALARTTVERIAEDQEPILLGLEDGRALFALDIDAVRDGERAFDGARVVGLRDAAPLLSRTEGGLAAYLLAMLNWHRRHRFCANCGAATAIAEGGYSRECPRCGAVHFPRTDPVVIMTVECGDRLLLGRRPVWPDRRYSVLAGFVSPGESLEEAVVREVREESGIVAFEPRYVASQPWPFPSSLMLGFEARSDGGEPVARDGELEDVRWFTREEVCRAQGVASGELLLPPPMSIARVLISRWVSGPR